MVKALNSSDYLLNIFLVNDMAVVLTLQVSYFSFAGE